MRDYSRSLGFSSITLGADLVYLRLPNIPADYIVLVGGEAGTNVINVASSASPGTNFLTVPITSVMTLQIPVNGNCSNLFFANSTVSVAQTVQFMWVLGAYIGVNG